MALRWFAIALVVICLLSSTGQTISVFQDKGSNFGVSDDGYCFQRISDTIGSLWLAHSNRMAFGRPFQIASPYPDDEEQTEELPLLFDANFPGRSRSDYLYGAGLWVGGIKENDTLVSHAFDFVAPVPELNPSNCPEGAFRTMAEWADIEHSAVAYDTIILGDTLFRCQVGDCHDWYPLGIKVSSHSYTWQSPPYDRTVIVEYTITNIDSTALKEGWVGIYADCDIGSRSNAYSDDVSGFIRGAFDSTGTWAELDIAYSTDMDGDPGAHGFDDASTTGAFGVQVLGLSVPGYRVNFNWWVLNQAFNFDWAPRQRDSVIRDLGGSWASPYGDSNKYFIMSYPEIDYNQVEAGLSHSGWLPPGEDGAQVASGNDTRFVISAGPFNLEPSEGVTFTVAILAGGGVLTNPYINLWFDPSDPMSVSDYYELLSLDELKEAGLAARAVYLSGYDLPPPGPPANFRLVDYDDDFASVVWSRKYAADIRGYRLLQKQDNGPWQEAAFQEPDDTTALISGLNPQRTYYFAVASVDSGGACGKPSPAIILISGLPHPPARLVGSCRQAYPVLQWTPSIDPDVASYRLYRVEQDAADTIFWAVPDTQYIDLSAATARTYDYYVTALTGDGRESAPSESVRLVPLILTSGILAVNHNSGNITSNLIFSMAFIDSLAARGLAGLPYTYRRADSDHSLTLAELARYSLVIISVENRTGALPTYLDELLPIYLANGGKLILICRYAAVNQFAAVEPIVRRFGPNSFFSKYLMIDSSYIGPIIIAPGYQLVGDLVGAVPVDSRWPQLHWDSIKVNQFGYHVWQGLPYTGFLWPRSPAEAIYRYESRVPDTITDGQVNAVRYKSDAYSFYLLNFPLSIMQLDSAAALLRTAVVDLGEQTICGDVNADLRFDIGDIVAYVRYLYGGPEPPALDIAGDVNCSGDYALDDVLVLINFFWGKGLGPHCCRQ